MATSGSLKILLLNQPWLKSELSALGHTIMTAGFGDARGLDFVIPHSGFSIDQILELLPEKPDRIVVFDDSSTLELFGFEKLEIPSIFYSVDAHHHSRWHRYFSSLFNLTLVAQRQHIPEFESENNRVKWFPLWPLKFPKLSSEREIKAVFRGNLAPHLHPERAQFFSELQKLVEVDASLGDWAEPYSKSLIVVNQTVGGDLNFRNFEAIAASALLITPRLHNGFPDLFIDGTDYISYEPGNVQDAADKIKYFLTHAGEAQSIAKKAYEKLIIEHTSQARATQLSDLLLSLTPAEKVNRNFLTMLSLIPSLISHTFKAPEERSELLLEECLRLLSLSLENKESLLGDFPNAGIMTVLLCMLEKNYIDELEHVARNLIDRKQIDETIGVMFIVAALLRRDKSEEALRIASTISANSGEFIWSVPGLLSQVRESVVASILTTHSSC